MYSTEMHSRMAIKLLQDFKIKDRYTELLTAQDWSVQSQDENNRLILTYQNKQSVSARTIEEFSLEFILQTLNFYFQTFLLKTNQQFVEMLTTYTEYLLIPQYLRCRTQS